MYHNDHDDSYQYGHNYRNYASSGSEPSIKGKIEQKYWKSKQKVIEKLGKGQDEFVIAGDAEVDSRLEAFQHIKLTCMQLMNAIEFYQSKIFALSQDENEMGRFLREQGAVDKTKAGKMMISVGKAQSFAAQQRLGLRNPLVRLFTELETFRFRAVQDTQLTVDKMEQARTDYRARLLWMADISKELDPDQNKRLGKFRDVQIQVKSAKKLFDKLKVDVVQKIDLLSASRCNLLSATLEPYQAAMVKFLSTTAKTYTAVYTQYQGHPSYQFQILKHILPNNGIVDDDEEDVDPTEDSAKSAKREKQKAIKNKKSADNIEKEKPIVKEAIEEINDDDDQLIDFDASSFDDKDENKIVESKSTDSKQPVVSDDLLGGLNENTSPGFNEFTATSQNNSDGFEDLLGKFEENNIPPPVSGEQPQSNFSLFSANTAAEQKPVANSEKAGKKVTSIDDMLFGSPSHTSGSAASAIKTDMDLLSEVLSTQSLGPNELDNSFSSQWQNMFGDGNATVNPPTADISNPVNPTEDDEMKMFMPSYLMEHTGDAALPSSATKNKEPAKSMPKKNVKDADKKAKDMSAWFNLFADLDPLANPDDIGGNASSKEKQAC